MTPLDIAKVKGHSVVVELLRPWPILHLGLKN